MMGAGIAISAMAEGRVRNRESSSARFWLLRAPASFPALSLRERSGSSTTPIATPITPRGSWYRRSA